MKIYVASSWRNEFQPLVVQSLVGLGHEVYDFKDSEGFHWSAVDHEFKGNGDIRLRGEDEESFDYKEDFQRYTAALRHPLAEKGFHRDFDAMEWADVFILVMPCGRSAHLEAGWAIGKGKPTLVFHPMFDGTWDLMYKMADRMTDNWHELFVWTGNAWTRKEL